MPVCLALTVQVPAMTKVMVAPSVPPEVHTEGVVVVKLAARPDVGLALTVTGDWARVALARAPKVIA